MRSPRKVHLHRSSSAGQQGFSLTELLAVVALIGLLSLVSMAGWQNYRKKYQVVEAAQAIQSSILKARMLSVYRGRDHFVVIDPADRRITIVADNGNHVYDGLSGGDPDTLLVGETRFVDWPIQVSLDFPPGTTAVTDPQNPGGTELTEAWSVAVPESGAGAGWTSGIFGVTATTTGRIQTAQDPPADITAGSVIFSDPAGQMSAVGIRGRSGAVKTYLLHDNTATDPTRHWRKL